MGHTEKLRIGQPRIGDRRVPAQLIQINARYLVPALHVLGIAGHQIRGKPCGGRQSLHFRLCIGVVFLGEIQAPANRPFIVGFHLLGSSIPVERRGNVAPFIRIIRAPTEIERLRRRGRLRLRVGLHQAQFRARAATRNWAERLLDLLVGQRELIAHCGCSWLACNCIRYSRIRFAGVFG